MQNANATVTVYHSAIDPDTGADVLTGVVYHGVSLFSSVNVQVTTDGLKSATVGTLRIPTNEPIVIANGYFVCEGSLQTSGVRPSDLSKLCPYVYTIIGITDNRGKREPHYKAVLK